RRRRRPADRSSHMIQSHMPSRRFPRRKRVLASQPSTQVTIQVPVALSEGQSPPDDSAAFEARHEGESPRVGGRCLPGLSRTAVAHLGAAPLTASDTETPERGSAKAGPKARLRTLDDLDRRTKGAQQALALRDALADDLGGWEQITIAERQLVENVAMLGAM